MGTRADFYVGRGRDAEWLGSIAWDGYPEGLPAHIKRVDKPENFREAVTQFIAKREDGTKPENGWPWPWETSHTTDYAYAFDDGAVWASNYGSSWWKASDPQPDRDDDTKTTVFPDMTARQKVTLGKRSGVIVVGPQGLIDGEP